MQVQRWVVLLLMLGLSPFALAASRAKHVRNLSLSASALSGLEVRAGPGRLSVIGRDGANQVEVRATIRFAGSKEALDEAMELALEEVDGAGRLTARFRASAGGQNPIDLEVVLPRGLSLRVSDGSGSIQVRDTFGPVKIEDGSGSIHVDGVQTLSIRDGSGSVVVRGVDGNVDITDGSGGIDVEDVDGSVRIRDGSGSIRVSEVTQDLIIEMDGSGSLRYERIAGDIIRN